MQDTVGRPIVSFAFFLAFICIYSPFALTQQSACDVLYHEQLMKAKTENRWLACGPILFLLFGPNCEQYSSLFLFYKFHFCSALVLYQLRIYNLTFGGGQNFDKLDPNSSVITLGGNV